ncbi:2-oxo-4-hydroxy-4-carboxy-5-ureidoimidazoline decarboxylase [bacterium]|nr:MAG: 2-oxo-4-hydroxy-4-carboxy-5-ureidoimidazoline decarboxylase [bacterium]
MTDNSALQKLNAATEGAAWDELLRCCGASKWVLIVMNGRPFANVETLYTRSEEALNKLDHTDWLEAFAHHPKIGDIDSLRSKFATTSTWAGNEQAGTNAASEATLQALAQGNTDYEDKFGFIFIICATGKSADEMLAVLQTRLNNDKETELQNAAEQQKQITRLRLGKLLEL